jgi:hypothetical protein
LSHYRSITLALSLLAVPALWAADTDFSGNWKLSTTRSEVRAQPRAAARQLVITHHGAGSNLVFELRASEPAAVLHLQLDGRESRDRFELGTMSTYAKWEGSALMLNTFIDERSRTYTLMERWTLSPDARLLTIHRTTVDRRGEVECTLIYERE